ncbi:alpha/beta fold hydrolase [Radiobacillus deserti]|uniref:alpha/beta fold hydrolase n=1 Tax=Radiobacillus deserti TaxID=2594883 RepID=UPI001E3CAB1A|nr:alpha/beta hydrolase [Radiobacillus deserti]
MAGPKSSEPIFVLQGGNCVNPITLSWFHTLAQTYRIYAPDTVGHPGFSEEKRISAVDNSFALWIEDLLQHYQIEKARFVGPSYGAGIILRLATYTPEKIISAALVAPAGIRLGSKRDMIKKILIPMFRYRWFSSSKALENLTDHMSKGTMKQINRQIIGDIFKYVKLEQEMPKLTERSELVNYTSPTVVITGTEDVFFPDLIVKPAATEIISNLQNSTYEMGHFPSEENLQKINEELRTFFANN